jgi:hypothetical protein
VPHSCAVLASRGPHRAPSPPEPAEGSCVWFWLFAVDGVEGWRDDGQSLVEAIGSALRIVGLGRDYRAPHVIEIPTLTKTARERGIRQFMCPKLGKDGPPVKRVIDEVIWMHR